MWMRAIFVISNLMVIMIFGWFLLANRRPLCIDSKIVEKLDVVTSQGQEAVYACYQRRSVTFSPYFNEMIPEISNRVHRVENLVKVIGAFKKPVKVEILLAQPWVLKVLDHSIYIGEQLFLSQGHLERAMFKIWYNERTPESFAHARLIEETMADFLLYLTSNDINIEDRMVGYKTRLGGSRWPQVLKSVQAYCESPWKASEHYSVCEKGERLEEHLADTILELSLRPLITTSLIDSYELLGLKQKTELLMDISAFVTGVREPPLSLVGPLWESYPSALLLGREIVKEAQNYFTRAPKARSRESYKLFVSSFSENLRKKGFQEASTEVHFDFIYESSNEIKTESALFDELKKLASAQQDLQVAVVDKNRIWFIPSKHSMDRSLFKEIKSRFRMVEACESFDFSFVFKYSERVEKLMVIDTCGKKVPHDLTAYLKDGAEGFARTNRDISFVQFHLPSLALRVDRISPSENVVQLIKTRDVNSPTLQALGWQELHWEKQIEAYKPKAQIDGIQYFRF